MPIYFDNAATTPVDGEVLEAMLPYFNEIFGNPSSVHSLGQSAHVALNTARQHAAAFLGCTLEEIIFTGCATESNNTLLLGHARANKHRGNHIITSAIEHDSILRACEVLQQEGFDITYVPVNGEGLIVAEDMEKAITPQTILISIMAANNEIGTIQSIAQLSQIARHKGIFFHTDAVQYYGYFPCKVDELGVDALTLSAHKFYGPKGVGLLYVRKNPLSSPLSSNIVQSHNPPTPLIRGDIIKPLLVGGGQEFGMRAGTQNVAGIVGMVKAMERVEQNREKYAAHVLQLRDMLLQKLQERMSGVRLNGSLEHRLPNNLNLSFEGIEAEALLIRLDLAGIAVSTGSACSVNSDQPSHVLKAIDLSKDQIDSSIRITLSKNNTMEDVQYAATTLQKIIKEFRT